MSGQIYTQKQVGRNRNVRAGDLFCTNKLIVVDAYGWIQLRFQI